MTEQHHRIFLLNGWSKSGKDTCADYLVEVHKFRKFSFAEAAKIQVSKEIQAIIIHKDSFTQPINFVISDWRLLDELLSLQRELYNENIKIIPIHIVRPSQLISPVPDTTEYSLLGFPFQYTITNPGTSEYFYRIQIMKILCEFLRNELPPPTWAVSYYA